ncbi:MAG: hypothetical protein LAP40_27755 [Acidobacteriia bacterium]|nr:hypothetical protein [Terriglobia bacterium]
MFRTAMLRNRFPESPPASLCSSKPTGRRSSQHPAGQAYGFSYLYNRAGALTSATYPSGRTVMNGYDTAGRLCSVSGATGTPPAGPYPCTVTGTSQITAYANAVAYTPQGSLQSIARGDGLAETWGYNNRLQATSVTVGSVGAAFGMNLYYCPGHAAACTSNNGNVSGITLATPGVDQNFAYDHLNRLTSIQEGANTQAYDYDNRGNRWWTQDAGLPLSSFVPGSAGGYNDRNQLMMASAQYADRGNQTAIGVYTFAHDGESRMATGTVNGAATTYWYDGDGRRVQKQNASGTITYVYDATGNLAAEYGVTVPAPCTTCYVSVDHLGSTRALTDAQGNVKERHDYMPFGDELFAGAGTRTTAQGYPSAPAAETLNPLFTGKERDAETGAGFFWSSVYERGAGTMGQSRPGQSHRRSYP